MIWHVIHILDIILWVFMAASVAYILFFALVSTLWKKRVSDLTTFLTGKVLSMRKKEFFSYLILYPAYNEDRVIVSSVQKFIGQYYPYMKTFQLVDYVCPTLGLVHELNLPRHLVLVVLVGHDDDDSEHLVGIRTFFQLGL